MEKEAANELRTSIDRLNAQVSYHIFSNTQLQRELDKVKGKCKSGDENKEIARLKAELQEVMDHRNELQSQVNAAAQNRWPCLMSIISR